MDCENIAVDYSIKHRSINIDMASQKPVVKKLFTPGPLTVSDSVREAGLKKDLGSRDEEFIKIVREIRQKLVQLAKHSLETHTAVLMQGSGTFSVEAVLNSVSNRKNPILLLSCGAYGKRMEQICIKAEIPHKAIDYPENESITLSSDLIQQITVGEYQAVAIVHSETTSGVINAIHKIGTQIKAANAEVIFIVDAMSSFGGISADYSTVDFLVSSANKCIQGIPGFGYVICNKQKLKKCEGNCTSLSLDLYDQWVGLESNGQFRFTPPTHSIVSFYEALKELEAEGGVSARYKMNNNIIKEGMDALGFKRFVSEEHDGHIITSFHFPNHPNFSFKVFYDKLSQKGQLIYPGKVTNADCFRIGNIGHLFPEDMLYLIQCIEQVLAEMGIPIPVS